MQQHFKKMLLPFTLLLPIAIISCTLAFTSTSDASYIGGFHMWYVHAGKKKQVAVHGGIRVEIEQILNKVDHLAGLSSYQLPTKYLLIKFDHPVVLSTFSPVKHPFQSIIVTIPQHRADQARLLIRNAQGSWVEYHTSRSLSMFIQQITPSSIKMRGLFVSRSQQFLIV